MAITGVVKYWSEQKGWGFIARDDGKGDCFVHEANVGVVELRKGDRVSFDTKHPRNGKNLLAVNVEVLNP